MRNIICLSLMLICFWVSLTSFTSEEGSIKLAGPQGDIALSVIANSKGAPSEISFSKLKSVFRGEQQRWKDGTKVTLALMKTNTPTELISYIKNNEGAIGILSFKNTGGLNPILVDGKKTF